MELRQMKYFVAISEELNFGRAAERLFISQPALSQQISALEDEIGFKLLNRAYHKIELTNIGEAFLDECKYILRRVEGIDTKLRQVSEELDHSPTLTIAIDPFDDNLNRYGVLNALVELRKRHPSLILTLKTLPYEKVREAFEEQKIDVGLYIVDAYSAKFLSTNSLTVKSERFCLLLPAHYAREHPDAELADVLKEFKLFLHRSDMRWRDYFLSHLKQIEPNLQVQYFDDSSIIFSFIGAGMGIAVSCETNDHRLSDDLVTTRLLDLPNFYAQEIILWDEFNPNPIVAEFMSIIKENHSELNEKQTG